MSIRLKKINIKKNFNYYFNLIYKFRNDRDYVKLHGIKKVIKINSKLWLKKNIKNRIFYLIKYKNNNAGIFNFNKQKPTFSQVIQKKYRNKKIGKISALILLKKLKKLGYFRILTYASKNNIASYLIHKSISYKMLMHNKKGRIYKFYINTKNF